MRRGMYALALGIALCSLACDGDDGDAAAADTTSAQDTATDTAAATDTATEADSEAAADTIPAGPALYEPAATYEITSTPKQTLTYADALGDTRTFYAMVYRPIDAPQPAPAPARWISRASPTWATPPGRARA